MTDHPTAAAGEPARIPLRSAVRAWVYDRVIAGMTAAWYRQVLARLPDGARLLDVREDSEWSAGHAAGAEHLGRGVLERDIESLVPDPGTELLLYCGGGYRSALAADALQKMGYTNVASMAGGWRAWQAAGAPTEK